MRDISRRQLLLSTSGFAVLASFPAKKLFAATNQYQQQIDQFVGGNKLSEGQLELDLPEIAENGNLVPLNVSIDSPMTDGDHITSIMVVAAGNPLGGVATFHFSPLSGEASASIRMSDAHQKLRRKFRKSFNREALQTPITFPGETFSWGGK